MTHLAVALDFPSRTKAEELVHTTSDLPVIYKVGMELFTSAGPEFVRSLIQNGKRVFLDLKFYDIPNTVARTATQLGYLQPEMFTVHIAGGKEMLRKTVENLDGLRKMNLVRPKAIGVSVLTSFDDLTWQEVTSDLYGNGVKVRYSITAMLEYADKVKLDGVVCSPHEVRVVKEQYPRLFTVVPGVRPKGSDPGDQGRVMTPAEASENGADVIVVGRPINQAKDPRAVAEGILNEIEKSS